MLIIISYEEVHSICYTAYRHVDLLMVGDSLAYLFYCYCLPLSVFCALFIFENLHSLNKNFPRISKSILHMPSSLLKENMPILLFQQLWGQMCTALESLIQSTVAPCVSLFFSFSTQAPLSLVSRTCIFHMVLSAGSSTMSLIHASDLQL